MTNETLAQTVDLQGQEITEDHLRDPVIGPVIMRGFAAMTDERIEAAPEDVRDILRDLRSNGQAWVAADDAERAADVEIAYWDQRIRELNVEIDEKRAPIRRALLKTACTATGVAAPLLALSIAFAHGQPMTPLLWLGLLAVLAVEASIADFGIHAEDR